MDCFTLRVRSFGFFLSYTIEIANKVTRSIGPYLQKRNLLIGLIMDCFTLRVRSFGYFSFSKLRGRRPRQSILRPLIQWTASHFMFAVSVFLFHMSIEIANEVTRSTDPYLQKRNLLIGSIMDCFTLRVRSFDCFFIFFSEIARPKAAAIHSVSSDTVDCFTLHVRSFGCFLLKKIKAEKTPPLSFLRILLFRIKTTATRSEQPEKPWTKS